MRYLKFHCKRCGSHNLTPLNKRQVKRRSFCEYHCESCGRTTDTVAYYVPNTQYIKESQTI